MSGPFFAICLPVFNGAKTIQNAVESVLRQTFADWQLTIIDNQSTDGTWELVNREYGANSKIRLFRNDRNLGIRGNLNRCLELAEGRWFGILADDDSYRLHALETIHAQLEPRDDLVLWTHGQFVHCGDRGFNAVPIFKYVTEFQAADLAEILYKRGNIFGSLTSYFIDLARVREAGIAFVDGEILVDLRFYVRILKNFPALRAIYWPDLLCCVNTDETTISHQLTLLGRAPLDLISHIGDLASLGWRKSTLLYQLLRLIKCSLNARKTLDGTQRRKLFRTAALEVITHLRRN